MRKVIWSFICRAIFKVSEGQKLPRAALVLRWLLFPYQALLLTNKSMNYDFLRDLFIIEGVKISRSAFAMTFTKGKRFEVIALNDGILSLKEII
jgi:hypothetical protein